MLSDSGEVQDPLTISLPTEADLSANIRITSFKGVVYDLYFGSVYRYTDQYSISVLGEVFMDTAQEAIDQLKDEWLSDLGESGCWELNYCPYGKQKF